jgi:hypothetical protein
VRLLFALLWTSIGLQLLCSLAIFALRAPGSGIEVLDATLAAAAGSLFGLVGAVLLWRRPQSRTGWLFAITGLGWSVTDLAVGYGARMIASGASWPGAEVALWLDGGNGWPVFVSNGLLIALVVTFPDGRLPSSRWRPFLWLVGAWTVASVLVSAFAAEPRKFVGGPPAMNPFAAPSPIGETFAIVEGPTLILTLVLYVAAAGEIFVRFRRSRGVERQQLKWFTASVALAAALVAIALPLIAVYGTSESAPPLIGAFVQYVVFSSIALIPVAAGVAILRYRLYDIDLLIKRTVVYGATTAAIAATFFLGILTLTQVLRPITQGNELAVAASTLASFALFQPVRRRVQDAVDQRFDRSRYDAARTLDSFADRLRDEVDLDALSADLIAAVNRTMAPSHASVWLRERTR